MINLYSDDDLNCLPSSEASRPAMLNLPRHLLLMRSGSFCLNLPLAFFWWHFFFPLSRQQTACLPFHHECNDVLAVCKRLGIRITFCLGIRTFTNPGTLTNPENISSSVNLFLNTEIRNISYDFEMLFGNLRLQ